MTQSAEERLYRVSVPATRADSRTLPWVALGWAAALLFLCLALVAAVRLTLPQRMLVQVAVDGRVETVPTWRATVDALLADLGIELRPEDHLMVADTALAPGMTIDIQRASPFKLEFDGESREVYSHTRSVGGLLQEAGVRVKPGDELWLDGVLVSPTTDLPEPTFPEEGTSLPARAWRRALPPAPTLTVKRAVPITIDDGTVPYVIFTTQPTVGEALASAELTLYLGDRIQPALGTAVQPGLRVFVDRSKSVLVAADGHTLRTRTRGRTVGDALVDLGVYVNGSDRVSEELDRQISDNMEIKVVRLNETVAVERQVIPFESIMVPDDNLLIDGQRLAQAGENGEYRTRYKVIVEDGEETSRSLVDSWVAAEPITRMTAYGRKLVSQPLETPEGEVSYWRKIRMYATSYSPARSGTPRTAAWYGRTRIGLPLSKGIVAVDPSVIPLRSRVYVPGYGVALAGDTGGGVRGKWIDLGFSDNDYESWHRWVDVYVLDPVPAPSKIRWVLPNYPPPGFPYRR